MSYWERSAAKAGLPLATQLPTLQTAMAIDPLSNLFLELYKWWDITLIDEILAMNAANAMTIELSNTSMIFPSAELMNVQRSIFVLSRKEDSRNLSAIRSQV